MKITSVVTLLVAGALAANAQQTCDRACLEGFVDQYMEALIAHKPRRWRRRRA
ncbi:MAG: hypothetical protein WDO18_00660 [Acidobacteriota bacterium]